MCEKRELLVGCCLEVAQVENRLVGR